MAKVLRFMIVASLSLFPVASFAQHNAECATLRQLMVQSSDQERISLRALYARSCE